ncbi:hypothetical protein HZH66_005908 [Vespula vulgaris]|uniref:Uncharacterized protein n=1 Tax=Vespula vulgaris TaxID=7454 RepID=A0A834K9B9_VESVU|nr:hypothetical protein HZH66_005908 [Vespula vulgaris]
MDNENSRVYDRKVLVRLFCCPPAAADTLSANKPTEASGTKRVVHHNDSNIPVTIGRKGSGMVERLGASARSLHQRIAAAAAAAAAATAITIIRKKRNRSNSREI